MLKTVLVFLIWISCVVSLYEYTFSTENIPKFRKIGDDMDAVQKRMKGFFTTGFITSTIIAILVYVFLI